ncbi:45731_t:CDS:2, partial [Gigaspora margarita]
STHTRSPMGALSRPLALAGHFQPSPTLDRLVKFFNSVPSLDKLLALVQYFSKVLIWFLLRAGRTSLAERLNNLGVPVADLRILLRIWSCRWWALYVALQFWHLASEWSILKRRRRELRVDGEDVETVQKQKRELKAEGDRIFRETLINVGYFPLTLHWSIENSRFPDVGVGVFGTLAAFYELSHAWRATE